MSQPNKPGEKSFKPGANMQHGSQEGMSESGNHASGDRANDTPSNQQSASATAKTVTHRDRTAGARGDKADGKR